MVGPGLFDRIILGDIKYKSFNFFPLTAPSHEDSTGPARLCRKFTFLWLALQSQENAALRTVSSKNVCELTPEMPGGEARC